MRRRTLLLVAVVLVVLVVGIAVLLSPVAPVATGYAAKTICSGHFVAGRTVEDVTGDLPANPLVPLLRTQVDEAEGTVRSTILGLWGTTAWHSTGLGCTLADDDPAFTAPTGRPSADELPERPADLPEVQQALDAAFGEDLPDDAVKGTRAVVVLQEGRLVAERYADGFDASTRLLGWSMAKSVANAIVGRLVMEGALHLDDRDLRSEWRDDDRADITVEHLLQMRSGLAFEEVYDPNTDATNMLFRPGSTAAKAAAKPLEARPGSRWSYSSGTTNILCDVAAEAAGLDGTELGPQLVFEPLGLDSAVLEPDSAGGAVCSSFLYATARDWARFGQWFLQDGEWEGQQLLPEGWVDWSTTPVELDTEHPYGAHWWVNEGPDGDLRMPSVPADAFWASGNEGQQVVVVPSADLVVVRLGLTTGVGGIDWGLERLLADLLAVLE